MNAGNGLVRIVSHTARFEKNWIDDRIYITCYMYVYIIIIYIYIHTHYISQSCEINVLAFFFLPKVMPKFRKAGIAIGHSQARCDFHDLPRMVLLPCYDRL